MIHMEMGRYGSLLELYLPWNNGYLWHTELRQGVSTYSTWPCQKTANLPRHWKTWSFIVLVLHLLNHGPKKKQTNIYIYTILLQIYANIKITVWNLVHVVPHDEDLWSTIQWMATKASTSWVVDLMICLGFQPSKVGQNFATIYSMLLYPLVNKRSFGKSSSLIGKSILNGPFCSSLSCS